jgi:hypothetical protein
MRASGWSVKISETQLLIAARVITHALRPDGMSGTVVEEITEVVKVVRELALVQAVSQPVQFPEQFLGICETEEQTLLSQRLRRS